MRLNSKVGTEGIHYHLGLQAVGLKFVSLLSLCLLLLVL